MDKQVKDVYVTLEHVRVGFETSSHPFVVFARFTDGSKGQPVNCASVREAFICGNGMLAALMAVNVRVETTNVVVDPRFSI